MKRITFARLAVLMLAVAGLPLQGCGGDDGVSQGMHDQVTQERDDLQMERDNLQTQINALIMALGATDVAGATDEVAALQTSLQAIQATLGTTDPMVVQGQIDQLEADLKTLRDAEQARMDEAERMMYAAMVATAAKLYAGISMPTATDADAVDTATATGTRFAQHTAADGATAGDIEVAIGDAANVFLSEDKDAMIADNHGWEGKRYTRTSPASEGMYEAVVFSNVEEPTMGKKFGHAGAADDDFEYQLTDGMITVDGTEAGNAPRVGGTSFDHTAGVKSFELPENMVAVMLPGTYHGVSGTYSCTPTTGNACAAQVAARGFNLGLVTANNTFTASSDAWTFKPTDPNAQIMEVADTAYASYGWWIHKAANDGPFTASAFVDEMGEVPAATGLDALNGTATYMGGAAGKYALVSSTGGTNDAGHFTARAMFEANFTNNTAATAITGTLDNFMGADDQPRNWSVKLNASDIGDGGGIGEAGDGTDSVMTVWTIDGTAADAAGNWTGTLRNNGDDGVPQVATGTFYTEYGTAGKMVGAFGANKDE